MAILNGKNAALLVANKKMGVGEFNGHAKIMYDEITLTAEAANLDTVVLGGLLPKNARVTSCTVKSGALGGAGTIDVGYLTNGVDASATAGFVSAGNAVAAAQISGAGLSIGKKLAAPTQTQLTFNGVTVTGTGKLIQVWTQYIVD